MHNQDLNEDEMMENSKLLLEEKNKLEKELAEELQKFKEFTKNHKGIYYKYMAGFYWRKIKGLLTLIVRIPAYIIGWLFVMVCLIFNLWDMRNILKGLFSRKWGLGTEEPEIALFERFVTHLSIALYITIAFILFYHFYLKP